MAPHNKNKEVQVTDENSYGNINAALSEAFTREIRAKRMITDDQQVLVSVQKYNMSMTTVPQPLFIMAVSLPINDNPVRDKALSAIQTSLLKVIENTRLAPNFRNINVDKNALGMEKCVKIYALKLPDLLAGVNQSLSKENQYKIKTLMLSQRTSLGQIISQDGSKQTR